MDQVNDGNGVIVSDQSFECYDNCPIAVKPGFLVIVNPQKELDAVYDAEGQVKVVRMVGGADIMDYGRIVSTANVAKYPLDSIIVFRKLLASPVSAGRFDGFIIREDDVVGFFRRDVKVELASSILKV